MLLSTSSISKYHNEKCILDKVSFSIEETDKIALIGVNGTGKTTFLEIVANLCECEGKMIRKSDLRVSYLPQQPHFNINNNVLQQVQESLGTQKVALFEIKSMLTKLGVNDFEQMLSTMSGGQQKRVALAIALLQPCDLLILDEPTNHLDNRMIEWLEKFLIKMKCALLMVTHDRYFLDSITNQIWEIKQSQITTYEGNYEVFLEKKALFEEAQLNQEKKKDAFLKKEIEWVRAGVQARGTKSKKRLDRFYELKDRAKVDLQKEVDMFKLHTRLGKKTIEIKNLGMKYKEKELFDQFNYHFKQNERLGIIGDNGCGKSTLLNCIAKELVPTSGEVEMGETVRLAYFKQGCGDMDETLKVIDYIKEVSDDFVVEGHRFSAKQMLERFLFDSQIQHTQIKRLSGGERRRLYLLKTLMYAPNVLLLDEPTNDLDITTLQILEDYLDHFQGIIICVSHDRYFLDRICDALLVFENGNIETHIGGYSSYMYASQDVKEKSDGAIRYKQQKEIQKQERPYMSSKDKQELITMEEDIERLNETLIKLDIEMEACESDYAQMAKLAQEREVCEKAIEAKSERWMYLLELEEQIKQMKNN